MARNQCHVRLSAEEREAFEAAAAQRGETLSQWLRRLGYEELKRGSKMIKCESGEWSACQCAFDGPDEDLVTIEFIPESDRDEWVASGTPWKNCLSPKVTRIRVCPTCREEILCDDEEWCREVHK